MYFFRGRDPRGAGRAALAPSGPPRGRSTIVEQIPKNGFLGELPAQPHSSSSDVDPQRAAPGGKPEILLELVVAKRAPEAANEELAVVAAQASERPSQGGDPGANAVALLGVLERIEGRWRQPALIQRLLSPELPVAPNEVARAISRDLQKPWVETSTARVVELALLVGGVERLSDDVLGIARMLASAEGRAEQGADGLGQSESNTAAERLLEQLAHCRDSRAGGARSAARDEGVTARRIG